MYGFRTGYYPCSKLFTHLKLARDDGSYLKELARIQKQDLFILDDLGLEPFDAPSRLSLLEILEDRLRRKSSIIVSQIPINKWHKIIGESNTTKYLTTRTVDPSYDYRPYSPPLSKDIPDRRNHLSA